MINGFGRSVEKKELKKANKIATKVQSVYEQKDYPFIKHKID